MNTTYSMKSAALLQKLAFLNASGRPGASTLRSFRPVNFSKNPDWCPYRCGTPQHSCRNAHYCGMKPFQTLPTWPRPSRQRSFAVAASQPDSKEKTPNANSASEGPKKQVCEPPVHPTALRGMYHTRCRFISCSVMQDTHRGL